MFFTSSEQNFFSVLFALYSKFLYTELPIEVNASVVLVAISPIFLYVSLSVIVLYLSTNTYIPYEMYMQNNIPTVFNIRFLTPILSLVS